MPEATPFQVMIVDDHPLMRRGVRQLLGLITALKWSPKQATARARSIWLIDWIST